MFNSFYRSFILFTILLLSIQINIPAQNNGTIKGTIRDTEGNPVPFANIILVNSTLGASADANGNYTIANVPAGTYDMRTSAVGYKTTTLSVTLQSGATVTQNFSIPSDILSMQTVVVTGTISPIPKLESSVAISTITPRQIEQLNPRSTTEVLATVPGFTRVESSGGEVNENISVRGILGVEYVMFMEDGLPVFPTMHTFFMNADNLFRVDENIQTVEVVRGGNSALYGSNTPGAIINFINKTGGQRFGGAIRATAATEDLARYDFNFNGPLGNDFRFNLGGFYRYDRGVRYPGFPGIRGGQIKANILKPLENGYVKVSAKYIDDRNQFILDLPFQNPDDPQFIPGFSKYGAFNTDQANNLTVPTPAGKLQFPLENGLRTQAYWLTTDINFNFPDAWTLRNSAQIMQDAQEWNGIFTGQPISANDWIRSATGAGVPAGTPFNLVYTNNFDAAGNKLPFDYSSNGGLAFISPSTLVTVQKPITAFQDQIQLVKTIEKKHSVSLGLYFANYTQTNKWFFSDILMDVRDNPNLLDLLVNGTSVTYNGFRHFLSLYTNGNGSTTIYSGVLSASLQITDQLRFDIGARYEQDDYVQDAENTSTVDLDANPATTYDIEQWGNNTYRHFHRVIHDWAYSGGLNYKFSNDFAVYVQASRAYKMPALDEFLQAQAQQQINLFENRRVVMVEGGIKYTSPLYAVTVNGFWLKLTNIVSQGFVIDTTTGTGAWTVQFNPDNRAAGAEIELSVTPIVGLNILGVGTFTQAKNIEAAGGAALTAGGIPKFVGNISANYTIGDFSIFGDMHFVSSRPQINAQYSTSQGIYTTYNTFWSLPGYNYLNLGASYRFPGQALTIELDVLNVYQSIGLEEGNPRLPGVKSQYFLARPILPRRGMLTLTYQF